SSDACPPDALSPVGTVCHTATNECDLTDTCSGTSPTCLTVVKLAGTACTDDGNVCTTDTCNGSTSNPLCQHLAGNAGTPCHTALNECDLDHTCTGASTTCLTTVKLAGTACTDDGNVCITDTCNGSTSNPLCQHLAGNAGTPCHTALNECDLDHTCTGASTTCPTTVKLAGTACTDDGNVCTTDACNGSIDNPLCTHPAGHAGTVCRATVNECDLAETCTGASTTCPADAVKAAGSACTDDGNPCTTDVCNGTLDSPACTHPAGNAGAVCRAAATECDLAATCTGTGTTCPADAVMRAGTACTADTNTCTFDQCDGTHNTCQHPTGACLTQTKSAAGTCVTDTLTGSAVAWANPSNALTSNDSYATAAF